MKIFRAKPARWYLSCDDDIELVDSFFVKRERQKPDFNRRMFDEDFARLFPGINRRSSNLFHIVSNDDELTQKLLGNVKTRYTSRLIDVTISRWVEEISQSLIRFGRVYYFLHDDTEQGEIHIASFGSHGVVRLFGTYLQWVPKRTINYWDRDDNELPREIRILDAAKIMRFDMPKSIKRVLVAQNKILTVLDKHQSLEIEFLSQPTHENPNPINHFDFRTWSNTKEHALYRATQRTGWNGRKYDTTKHSDFFDCHRLVRFRRNQLMLRDNILRQLSVELSRVGQGYKADFFVDISGTEELPSVRHLDELELRLEREEVGFKDIVDYCYNV